MIKDIIVGFYSPCNHRECPFYIGLVTEDTWRLLIY